MNDFFYKKTIHVEMEGFPKETFKMRPLRIYELSDYFEAVEKSVDFISSQLITLLAKTIDRDITNLPIAVLPKLLEELSGLSFPEWRKRDRKLNKEDFDFVEMMDFLISQGHRHHEILRYTTLQFRQYIEAAMSRLTGKKKKMQDPLKALLTMKIPIRGK